MKVTIVGAINFDTIITFKGEKKTGLGGILYNAVALASMFKKDDVICPVSKVGENHINEIKNIFSRYSNVDMSGLNISAKGTNENFLKYVTEDRRDEILKDNIGTIDFGQIKSFLDSDAILFNFISGFEISRDLIEQVKKQSKALLLMDVHNKVFGMDKDGKRFPSDFKDWKIWMKSVDIIQANEIECELISGRKLDKEKDFIALGKEFLNAGPRIILITLGPKGSIIISKEGNQCYYHSSLPSPVENMVDTTGCGDAFSAGFVYGYLKWKNPVKANAFANVVAGINCEDAGLNGFGKLNIAEQKLQKVFPELIEKIEKGYKGELC